MELGALLEPGRPPKTDKAAILVDAVRMVTQLRGEAQKLKDSNSNLQDKIKELKVKLVIFIAICVTVDMYFTFIIRRQGFLNMWQRLKQYSCSPT